MNTRGQTTLPEYVLLLFIVVAFAVAITVYAQRALQARIYDARNFAVSETLKECGEDCKQATGGGIAREYEPYYANIEAYTNREQEDKSTIEGGVAKQEGIFTKDTDITSKVTTESRQKPPKEAN